MLLNITVFHTLQLFTSDIVDHALKKTLRTTIRPPIIFEPKLKIDLGVEKLRDEKSTHKKLTNKLHDEKMK